MTCGQSGVAMGNLWLLLAAGGVMAAVIGFLTLLNNRYTLNNIKSKTVGDGQHGTARWATDAEIRKTYALVPFQAASWRKRLQPPAARSRRRMGQNRLLAVGCSACLLADPRMGRMKSC